MRPTPARRLAAQWFATALLALSGTALAEPLGYASGFDALFRVNMASGQATRLGPIGFNDVEGLAMSPSGVLYGVADATMLINNQPSATTDFLVRLDINSGAGTLVGQLSTLQSRGPGGNLDYGLAFTCDGRLWMSSDTTGELWEVDAGNGSTRLVGSTGVALSGLAGRGNTLYGVSVGSTPSLFTINQANAAVSTIGPLNAGGVVEDAGLDFDANGVLWATLDPEPAVAGPSRSARLNLETGAATVIGNIAIGTGVEALAIAPPGACEGSLVAAPVLVPGPGAPLLLLLAGLFALLGRRRLPS